MSKLANFAKRIKQIKNIELYLALIAAVIVVVAIVASNSRQKNAAIAEADNSYIATMEHKISNVVQKLDGCGNATVAISYSCEARNEYAYETQTTTNSVGTVQSSTVVSVKGEPLVLKSYPPTVLGVVVVAEGATDPIVKMKITNIVVTLLGIDSNVVQVFAYKS